MELNLSTMAPALRRMITQPLEGLTAEQREAVIGLRQMYCVAAHFRDEAKRRQWSDEMIDREKTASRTIRSCIHGVSVSQEIETRDLLFQHGTNPEHTLRLSLAEGLQYPSNDIPVAEWIAACHDLTQWWKEPGRGAP